MKKLNKMEYEIHQKEKRIANWERTRVLPGIVQTVRVMNKKFDPQGLGGIPE